MSVFRRYNQAADAEDWKYEKRRLALVNELREKGIADEAVLEAIGRVPRQVFVEDALRSRAYRDEALPIGLDQTISQPFTVAYQTACLDVSPGDKVLEIGTGSGYQAAVLCEMGAHVFTIERLRPLYERARIILQELGYRLAMRCADGSLGWEEMAPFDGILVTAAATEIPVDLIGQLRIPDGDLPGGRLVIPVGGDAGQTMTRLQRVAPDRYEREELHEFRFVPLVHLPPA